MVTNNSSRVFAWAAVLVAIAAGLFIINALYEPILRPILAVLLPFSVAVTIALMLDPAITAMARRGISRTGAIAVVAVLFLSSVAILMIVLVPLLVHQTADLQNNLPKYGTQVQLQTNRLLQENQGLLRRFHLPTRIQDINALLTTQAPKWAEESLKNVGSFLGGLASTAVWLVLIPIITVFLLPDIDRLKKKTLLLSPERHRKHTEAILGSVGRVFGAYIRGLLTVALLYGIACGVAIWLWGVPYAAILGAAAAALSLIPYIGTISTLIIVALVTVISELSAPSGNPMKAVWVAATILLLNQLFDNFLSPKLVGKAVGIHPALAIFALLVGGQMFGLVGMVISVPVAASIQLLVLEFYPAMGGPAVDKEKPAKPPLLIRLVQRIRNRKVTKS